MQLLNSRAVPGAEFVSFSVLLRGGDNDASAGLQHPLFGVEPLLFPNPLSTFSQTSCIQVLAELHTYIHHVVRASKNKNNNNAIRSTTRNLLLQDDENLLTACTSNTSTEAQIFRAQHGNGIALHYRVVRDKKRIEPLLSLLFAGSRLSSSSSSTSSSAPNVKQPNAAAAAAAFGGALQQDVTGVVFCVGISGLPSMYCTSPMTASLGARMRDCLDILQRTPSSGSRNGSNNKGGAASSKQSTGIIADLNAVRSLVTTLLLTEDEDRMTNSMAAANQRLLIAQDEKDTGSKILGGSTKRPQQQDPLDNPNSIDPDENPLHFNSADHARLVVERLAILSVCESDTTFRRFEGRSRENASKKRSRKSTRDADLDGFDYRGGDERTSTSRTAIGNHIDPNSSSQQSVSTSSTSLLSASTSDTQSLTSRRSTPSTPSPGLALRGPRKDTTSRSAARGKASPAPLLSASAKDSGTRNRRAASSAAAAGPVISNFPGASTHSKQMSMRSMQSDAVSLSSAKTPTGSVGARSQSQSQGRQQFDPFASQNFDTPTDSESAFGHSDADDSHVNGNHNTVSTSKGRSRGGGGGGGGGSGTKVLVNIALNEDLTCFYKLSKMSSCSVEGVVQVQVQTNADQGVPFFLLIRDPAKHIQTVQENRKFADNMAESIQGEHPSKRPDYMFTVSVPKSDNYFPVMRYKCGPELRPVPIRVQTRVREEDDYFRVALQISSNPHNEDNLSDLTIIMGVPPAVIGETLTTSPAGGVWNASKRSVIWCVSELGGGEKFQLQARFEIDHNAPVDVDEEMPKFPVLVRCQCMYAQLSDIEVDVQDIPQVVNAEVRMKLAKRFRLSHRERP